MKHIKFLLFMLTLFFCFTCIHNDLNSRLQNITELNTRYRAFSLRVLQEQLNGAVTDRRIESIENFAGITKMIGYIIDQDNEDLILYGIVDGDLPKLHLEDFVVALRNVWGLYRHKYGHHNPACSIDPYSHNSKRLERIAQSITPHISRSLLQEIKQFEEACTALQEVNVYGIPFHTRFAKIMVQADYKMKKYVDGSESLPFEDYSCLIDIYIAKMIRDVENNESPPLVMTNWNRFWFYPGPQFLTESDNIVRIDRCPVYLLTNRIYHSGGQLRDSRQVDCLAEKFAEYITLNYNKIKKVLPIYQELENLFRFVALSRAIHLKSAHEKSGIDLSYLLHQFPIPVDSVNKELPGCFSMKSDTIWQSATTGFCYALPSCGGVEIDINIKGSNFISIEHGYVNEFASSAIASRPSQGALSWDINLRISNFLINAIASNSDARSQILFVVSKRKNNKQMVDLISSDKQIEVPRDQITSFINNPKQISVLDPLFPKRRGKETVNIILVTDGFKGERSKLLLAIRQRYGDQYRPWDDDEMTLGMKNLQNLPTIKGVSDIAVYFDMNRKCLEKAERKLLSEIITFLKNNNIEAIKNLIETPASNIIIITHQKAEKFDKYLNKLLNKNLLQDKVVFPFTTGQPLSERFTSHVISHGGAKAVIAYPHEISVLVMYELLSEMIVTVKTLTRENQQATMVELILESVNKILAKFDTKQKLKLDLEKILQIQKAILTIKEIESIQKGSDVVIYAQEPKKRPPKDFSIISNLQDYFDETGIKVRYDMKPVPDAKLVIIVGHKDEDFRRHIKKLGNSGALLDKYVAVFSCGEKNEGDFNKELLKTQGVRALFFFTKEINPNALVEVLLELNNFIQSTECKNYDIYDLLIESAKRALQKCQFEYQIHDLEELRDIFPKVSFSNVSQSQMVQLDDKI